VNLISEGFQDAKALGRKLVALFSLGRQLLSKQQHYDWGLRALKTVLGTAGQLLHQAKGKGEEVSWPLVWCQSWSPGRLVGAQHSLS
jgi:dynein heavy chain 2